MNRACSVGVLVFALLFVLVACDTPFEPGSATVSVDPGARSITPEPAPEPVEYRVTGDGPAGARFEQTVAALPLDVSNLVAGEWAIRVQALGDAGAVVLEGTAVALVTSDGPALVSVVLAAPVGTGRVDLTLDWPAGLVASPAVSAVLHRDGRDPVELESYVDAAGGTATVTGSSVDSGWYRLVLRLSDGGTLVAGRAELLEVLADATTGAAITLDELNKQGEAVTVTGSSFTLAWDTSAGDPSDPVAGYNVYYRVRGTYPWTPLGSTASLTATFTVTTAVLDYGIYEFAVTAVASSGAESEPHTSLDDDALPQSGWFIDWRM